MEWEQNSRGIAVNEPETIASGGRIRELDGLRAIAISMVVAWHYIGLPAGGDSISGNGILYYLFRPGRTGVDLFFVLSGFLITSILIEQKGAANYFQVFYGRRALRILPVYALMVCGLFIGREFAHRPDVFGPDFHIWSYVVFVQNIEMARFDSYGADFLAGTWSLAIEEQFYLVFPLVVLLAPVRVLPKILVGVLALVPILRILTIRHTGHYLPVYVLTTNRADALGIGALIAWALADRSMRTKVMSNVVAIRWAACALLVASPLLWTVSGKNFPTAMAYWGHTYLTLLYGTTLLLVLTHAGSPVLWPLRTRGAASIAAISYTLYLVHGPVRNLIGINGNFPVLWSLIALTISLAICTASYVLLEQPCLRFGRRTIRYRRPARSLPVTADEAFNPEQPVAPTNV